MIKATFTSILTGDPVSIWYATNDVCVVIKSLRGAKIQHCDLLLADGTTRKVDTSKPYAS